MWMTFSHIETKGASIAGARLDASAASRLRGAVTPARRGRGGSRPPASTEPPAPKHVSMTWMQRLKRVFAIAIDTCQRCGGPLKVIASIEDPELIANLLSHLQQRSE